MTKGGGGEGGGRETRCMTKQSVAVKGGSTPPQFLAGGRQRAWASGDPPLNPASPPPTRAHSPASSCSPGLELSPLLLNFSVYLCVCVGGVIYTKKATLNSLETSELQIKYPVNNYKLSFRKDSKGIANIQSIIFQP